MIHRRYDVTISLRVPLIACVIAAVHADGVRFREAELWLRESGHAHTVAAGTQGPLRQVRVPRSATAQG